MTRLRARFAFTHTIRHINKTALDIVMLLVGCLSFLVSCAAIRWFALKVF